MIFVPIQSTSHGHIIGYGFAFSQCCMSWVPAYCTRLFAYLAGWLSLSKELWIGTAAHGSRIWAVRSPQT